MAERGFDFCRFSQFTIDLRQGNIVKYPQQALKYGNMKGKKKDESKARAISIETDSKETRWFRENRHWHSTVRQVVPAIQLVP